MSATTQDVRSQLRIEIVRSSTNELLTRKIHPLFVLYLCLKHASVTVGRLSGLQPDWSGFFDAFFRVPGGPADKPYYRPFWNERSEAGQGWLNQNLAGSFAPSSIRDESPVRKVIDIQGGRRSSSYSLRSNHAALAREHLLYDSAVPVVPLTVFMYREYTLTTADAPTAKDLVTIFRSEFGYDQTPDEFPILFDDAAESLVDSAQWFVSA